MLFVAATLPAAVPQAQAPASGKSFLWKVQQGAAILYLAGSVHALDQSVYPLGSAFQRAFDASSALVEEIDLDQATSPTAAPMLFAKGMFQDGRTFDQVVTKDTLALVTERLKGTPLPLDLIKPMKPWMVDMLLTALDVQQAGLDAAFGLDKHFFDRAKAAGKEIIPLETAESQIERLDAMPLDVQEQMLRSSLKELTPARDALGNIVTLWKQGDAASLERTLLSEFDGFPAAYQSLVVERNRNWMPQIEACLARRSPCFVVVGAAHVVGKDGLLAMLRQKGYTVEQQ